MKRVRLDVVLIQRGSARDAEDAFILVTEGRVFVNGQKAVSPAQLVSADDVIEVRPEREYVGRGAYKLDAALEAFGVQVSGKVCADVGAATGGFTEVLLKRGAKKVYAIDAGRGKLDLKLRQDPRVIVMEELNLLKSDFHKLLKSDFNRIDVVTVDLSFTSLRLALPVVRGWLTEQGRIIALFKPQYEIGDKSLLEHGVLRDERTRAELVEAFRSWLSENGWRELGFMESPIRGSAGNAEYLFHLTSEPSHA